MNCRESDQGSDPQLDQHKHNRGAELINTKSVWPASNCRWFIVPNNKDYSSIRAAACSWVSDSSNHLCNGLEIKDHCINRRSHLALRWPIHWSSINLKIIPTEEQLPEAESLTVLTVDSNHLCNGSAIKWPLPPQEAL